MNSLYTFLPPKAIPFWGNFPKNRRFPSGGGADAGGCTAMAARTRGGMHSDGGADAGGMRTAVAARMHRSAACRGPPCPSSTAVRHARHPPRPAISVIRTRHAISVIHRARHARHPPRPAMPVIHRRPPCPSSARGPPCPSSAAARHARHPPRPAVPVIRRGPSSAARSAQTKKAPRGARDVFSDAARARAHTRRAGREKFFRCCAGAYAPPAGASGSVTSPIFSMRSSLTAVRPLRSA